MKKQQKTRHTNQSWAKIMLGLIVITICFSMVLGADWDNTKSYDSQNKIVTITNALGLGGDIATIQLKTPQINYVFEGKDRKVAEFDINLTADTYQDVLKQIELTNNKNGKTISRTITYKYKTIESYEVDVNDYKETCSINIKNGSQEDCRQDIIGSHKETKERELWTPLEKLDLTKGKITIGLFTDVYKGDNIEWILTLFGVRVIEWATWTDSFNVGLVSYYSGDNEAGAFAFDKVNKANNTMINTANNRTTGIIGNGYGFVSGSSQRAINNTPLGFQTGNQNISISFWAKRTGTGKGLFALGEGATSTYFFIGQDIVSYGGVANDLSLSIMPNLNEWYHIIFITNTAGGGNITVWQNGIYSAGKINSAPNFNFNKIFLGYTSGAGYFMDGIIDEVGIWNRTLSASEISNLYNSGSGMTYVANPTSQTTVVTLNSPIDYYNSTSSTIQFNCSAIAGTGNNLTNISLWTNKTGVWNITNTQSLNVNNYTYISSANFSEGLYKWNCIACDNNSICNFSISNRTVSYSRVFQNSIKYNSPIGMGTTQTFTINTSTTYPNIYSYLVYNGTKYLSTKTNDGVNTIFSNTITIPPVSLTTNYSFYYEYNNIDGSLNSSRYNQSVIPLSLDNCSVNTYNILNYTIFDEDTNTIITPTSTTSIQYDIKISSLNNILYTEYSGTKLGQNNISFCLSNSANVSLYRLDSTIKYLSDNRVTRYNHLQNKQINISNTPINIILRDLNSTTAIPFTLYYTSGGFSPQVNYLLDVQKFYTGESSNNLTIETAITDTSGNAQVYLITNTNYYQVIVSKDGQYLETFNIRQPKCQAVPCMITINSITPLINTTIPSNYLTLSNPSITSLDIFNLDYAKTNGVVSNMLLKIFYGNTNIMNLTSSGLTGTLTGNLSSYAGETLRAELYMDNSYIAYFTINVPSTSPYSTGGYTLLLMGALMFIILVLMAYTNNILMLIMEGLGFFILGILNIYNSGSIFNSTSGVTLFCLIIIIIMFIIKLNSKRETG